MRKLLSILLVLISFTSLAYESPLDGDLRFNFGGWSHHLGGEPLPEPYEYNESNDFLGVEYKGFGYMSFTTSYYDPGYILYYDLNTNVLDFGALDVEVGALLGLVHGYTGDLVPSIVPHVGVWVGPVGLDLATLPTFLVNSRNPVVLILTARLQF